MRNPEFIIKKPKRWHCNDCGKEYCYIYFAHKHSIKKHDGKAKFSDLLELKV